MATGQETKRLPVLWAAGCQGVGMPPVLTDQGPIVCWRTAYSNWNLGVAPLVGLGFLDLAAGRVRPIRHESGPQPPWNTFWGTADESQNLSSAGDLLIISHQGTLSALNLATCQLQPIAGQRDTWGGYPGLPGLRNEWHGPARSAAAISQGRLYWLSGSRLIAVESGGLASSLGAERTTKPQDASPQPLSPVTRKPLASDDLQRLLEREVRRFLEGAPWAPLYVDQGIGGREFVFTHSAAVFQALSLAYPHLPEALQERVRTYLAAEWAAAPPLSARGRYALDQGHRRELFDVPAGRLTSLRPATDPEPGALNAVGLYAQHVAGWDLLHAADSWTAVLHAWKKTDFDHAPAVVRNRVFADGLAMEEIARQTGHPDIAAEARLRSQSLRRPDPRSVAQGRVAPKRRGDPRRGPGR